MNEMTDHQKSIKLAEYALLGYVLYSDKCKFLMVTGDLFYVCFPFGWRLAMTDREIFEKWFPDLYDPKHMALAKKIIMWAEQNIVPFRPHLQTVAALFTYAPDGQRRALDCLLGAIVEVDNMLDFEAPVAGTEWEDDQP